MTIAFAVVVAVVAMGLIGTISRALTHTSRVSNYFNQIERLYRLAETGLFQAIGNINTDPSIYDPASPDSLQDVFVDYEGGKFKNIVQESHDQIVFGGYYIQTIASRTVAGKNTGIRLHSHVLVSNVAEYFWAVQGDLILAAGTDASDGKVYAYNLDFRTDISSSTKVKKAEYGNSVYVDGVETCLPKGAPVCSPVFTDANNYIDISEPGTHLPQYLGAPLTFPQILDSDIDRYKSLANFGEADHHVKCDFTVDSVAPNDEIHLYPPGYLAGPKADDDYSARHTNDPTEHVYYCNNPPIKVGTPGATTYVHGQILLVTTGTIEIGGTIMNATGAGTLPDPINSVEYGTSTAHQLVLMTRGDVVVNNNFHPGGAVDRTLTIHAFILAPHGMLSSREYPDTSIHLRLSLRFEGAMVLKEIANTYDNFGTVFQDLTPPDAGRPRTYKYMSSLAEDPPPYLPAIVEIHYSLEQSPEIGSIF